MGTEYVLQIEVVGIDYKYPMKGKDDTMKEVVRAHGNVIIGKETFVWKAYPNDNRMALDMEPDDNIYHIKGLRDKLKGAVMSVIGQINMPFTRRATVK